MSNEILVTIKASDPDSLAKMVQELAKHMGGANVTRAVMYGDSDSAVTLSVEPGEKRGRGRPKGGTNKPSEDVTEADAVGPVVADEARQDEPETKAAPAETPASNSNIVQDLTEAKAREQAIGLLQTFFGKNPNSMAEITKLQTKYGVKMFAEVPDARAAEFLADAKLVTSGNAMAA